MKNKKIFQIASLVLCLVFAPSMIAFAEEGTNCIENIYDNISPTLYVDDINEYLAELNTGMIEPMNSKISTCESAIMPFGTVSEPSKSCSNIFGHKWTDWQAWEELYIVHHPTGTCVATIERKRYCTRTHCGAYQREVDAVWLNSCSH